MKEQRIAGLIFLVLANVATFLMWWILRTEFEFETTKAFYLLFLVPLISIIYLLRINKWQGKVVISSFANLPKNSGHWRGKFRHSVIFFELLALALLVFAIARPQSKSSYENRSTEGIDIVISMDVSVSMLAKDFEPNRLESAKDVAQKFVDERPNDRIGMVVFEGESYTQSPLTTDHRVVKNAIRDMESGKVQGGTAIGMGLATAVNRLKDSEAKSKVVILLTDGVNNQGQVKPIDAAKIAKAFNIRVHTIGVGSTGKALMPVAQLPNGQYQFDYRPVEIDEEVMKEISSITGGSYFRATSEDKLKEIYEEIDQLEKTEFKVTEYSKRTEEFLWFGVGAGALLLFSFLLKNIAFRSIS